MNVNFQEKKERALTVDLGDTKMFFSTFFGSHFSFQRIVLVILSQPCVKNAFMLACAHEPKLCVMAGFS